MSNATEFLMVMRERHWRQLHTIEGEPDYCGGCINSKSWPCYEAKMLDEIKAENARLREQAEALATALAEIVSATERWNASVETIIGRQPNTSIDLVKADAALRKYREEPQ